MLRQALSQVPLKPKDQAAGSGQPTEQAQIEDRLRQVELTAQDAARLLDAPLLKPLLENRPIREFLQSLRSGQPAQKLNTLITGVEAQLKKPRVVGLDRLFYAAILKLATREQGSEVLPDHDSSSRAEMRRQEDVEPYVPESTLMRRDMEITVNTIDEDGNFEKGSPNFEKLRHIIFYFRIPSSATKFSVASFLVRLAAGKARAALRDALYDKNPAVVEGALLTLGWINGNDKATPSYDVDQDSLRVESFLRHPRPEIQRAAVRSLRYMHSPEGRRILSAALDEADNVFFEILLHELPLWETEDFIEPLLNALKKRRHKQRLNLEDIPASFYLALSNLFISIQYKHYKSFKDSWLVKHLITPEGRILAYKFGFIDAFIYEKLETGAVEQDIHDIKTILKRTHIVTENLLKLYQKEILSARELLLLKWDHISDVTFLRLIIHC
jgi:hypothetical protein